MDIQKVGVVGCGLMGSGIAEVAAKAYFDVVVREVSDELVEAGRPRIRKSLERAVEKGKLTVANRDAAWSRLRFTTELSDLADRHLVIEAIVEEIGAKNELWEGRYAPPPLLKRIVSMGRFGRKTGKGFYDWSGDQPIPLPL